MGNQYVTKLSCAGLTRASTWIRLKFRLCKAVDGRVKHGHDDMSDPQRIDFKGIIFGQVLRKAAAEGRIVLTFDLDFAERLALDIEKSPSVVIFRLHDETPASVNPRLLEILNLRQSELDEGALIVVEDSRYRMRRLPIED